MSDPEPNNDRYIEIWNKVLRAALSMPGVRIDRTSFLRKELSKRFPESVVEKAIQTRPALAGIPKTAIRSIAQSCIAWHKAGVSAISFVISLPGGWWIAATAPADQTQFFWHAAVILQKLAYLYGWPSLTDKDEQIDDETVLIFTVFIGVMFGAGSASKVLGELAERVAEQVVKRLPQKALTKWGLYRLAKEVAKWIGVRLTKTTFAKGIAKVIPLISGLISGGITWLSFSAMSKRLRVHLERLILAGDN